MSRFFFLNPTCFPSEKLIFLSSIVPAAAATAAAAKSLQSCPTLQPHRWQPTRLLHPWDSPGKNTGVGCHSFSNACMHGKLLQSCPTLCDPRDGSLPGSSVHRILQARILEWVAVSFSTYSP